MPWKVGTIMDQRIEFVSRRLRGERLKDLCLEFGISTKTGKKLLSRYRDVGALGLEDQSRRPHSSPRRTSADVAELLVETRRAHPTWGPRKIKAMLERQHSTTLPAPSTIGDILSRRGLVEKRKRRRCAPPRASALREATAPNQVWCIDYKGEFRFLKSSLYCYPLTLTDQFSRFLLGCDAFSRIATEDALQGCTEAFRRFGLPEVIRSDNGAPFASVGLAGLSTLSVWWLRLGIKLERIDPGMPQQNGRHERMHRTLKRETTRPPSPNLLQQQERFDRFADEYNNKRPHDALEMRTPSDVYTPSSRTFPERLDEPAYPLHDDTVLVHRCGHVHVGRRNYFLTKALGHELVGIREEDDGRWLVSFLDIDLGYIDVHRREFVPMQALPPQS